MELIVDVYYKNEETGKIQIFHDKVTQEDISNLIKERNKGSLPMWMDEKWEFDKINVDKINL